MIKYSEIYKCGDDVEKIKAVFLKIREKISVKKAVAVIVAAIVLVQILTSVLLNFSVLGVGGIKGSKKDEFIHIELSEEKYIEWYNNTAETLGIEGENGHTLMADVLSNYKSSHSYIIISHPYGKLPSDMAEIAYHFYDLGFHVSLPFMRGFGESDYNSVSMGVEDYKDILKWVEEITENDKNAKIFLFGMGLGGTASLLTADKELPENVKGIIADSAYSDIKGLFKHNIKELYSLPSFPTVEIGSLFNKLINGWSYNDIDLKSVVKNSQVPILYVQAGEDQVVPQEQINDLYDITYEQNSDYILISGATHCENYRFEPNKYWNAVDLFILNTMDL